MSRRLLRRLLLAIPIGLLALSPVFAATTVNAPIQSANPQVNFSDLAGSATCAQLPALTGDATTSVGSCATTVAKVNGVSYGASPSTNTVPVVTGSNTVTYEAVPNAALANSSTTVNGTTCTLGSTCTVAGTFPGAVTTKTTSYTVLSTDNATWFNNSGAGGSVVLTLPSSPATNQVNCGMVEAAQTLEFLAPASTKINVGNTASAAAGNVQSNTTYDFLCVVAVSSTQWMATNILGTWTIN